MIYLKAFQNLEEIRRCVEFLMDESEKAVSASSSSISPPEPKLVMLAKLLSRVFRGKTLQECQLYASDYKIYLVEDNSYLSNNQNSKNNQKIISSKPKRILNFWCFSPGVAMEDLKRLGVRSVIITSGTLSPMDSFRYDLKIPFPVMLENPHVLNDHQIWVGALSSGPTGKQLNSSYSNRDSNDYKVKIISFSLIHILVIYLFFTCNFVIG